MKAFLHRLLKNPMAILGLLVVTLHVSAALLAPWLVAHDPYQMIDVPFELPSTKYWIGTDDIGRDFYSRVLMGGRLCMLVALVAGAIAALGVGLIGLFAAYRGGVWDETISRLVEMQIALPAILFVSLFVTGFGQSWVVLIIVIGVIKMMGVIRTARAQGLVLMSQGFIMAAKLRGESAPHIILREMLPNILDLLSVEFALRMSSALLLVSTLSFLGLGLSPPTPDWGLMVHEGLQSIRSQPWLILVPAGCIASLVLGINFATEGLADALGLEVTRGVAGR